MAKKSHSWQVEMKQYFTNTKMLTNDHMLDNTDMHVKFCEMCSSTWESFWCPSNKSTTVMYHGNHIPSIGKCRSKCPECESKVSTSENIEVAYE